jgi:RNA polymerase sigma-70 factor (ECF subfamily)
MADERMDEDAALMVRVSGGDQQAFAVLVERYRLRALNFAYRFLGDREAAEDVAQEAFVRVYQSRHRYRPQAAYATWFYHILSNLCLNEIRRRKRQGLALRPESAQAAAPPNISASPDALYQQLELSAAVRRALAKLPDKQRLAVILQRFEGLDYAEIGRVMGISRGAVDGLLSRAKESVRRELSGYST